MSFDGVRSISTPAGLVLDVLLGLVGLQIAAQALLVGVLLADPRHPAREYFRVTAIVGVPTRVWPTEGVVRADTGLATVRVDPWAFLTYQPASRAFVAVSAVVSFSWWACAVVMLLQLRRALGNISAGTPFPRDNIRRIRLAGWAILGMAAVKLLMGAAMFGFMRATTSVAGGPAALPVDMLLEDFPLGTILAGLAVVILAEIFRAGADLQDEQALTV